jgi:hypothetical protein
MSLPVWLSWAAEPAGNPMEKKKIAETRSKKAFPLRRFITSSFRTRPRSHRYDTDRGFGHFVWRFSIESEGSCQINNNQQTKNPPTERRRLWLSLGLRRSDVFFGYFPIRPRTAQVKKLQLEESNHLDFRRKTPSFKYSLVAVIVFLVFIVMTPVGIQLSFVRVGRTRNN